MNRVTKRKGIPKPSDEIPSMPKPKWLQRDVHAELIKLSIPTVISTLAVPMLGIVDTAVLGRLPDVVHLGAAATATTILNSIFWVFGFLRMGTTALVGQAIGAGDEGRAARVFFQAVVIGAAVGLGLVALQGVIGWGGLRLMGAAPDVTALAKEYFAIRIFEAPVFVMTLAAMGYLRGRGDALTPMVVTIGVNVINAVGDIILVPGAWGLPSLGVKGAAWASLVAQWSGGMALALVIWPKVRSHIRREWLSRWRELPWGRFLQVQRDLFVRTILLTVTLGAVTALAARLHLAHELAAHAILLQLWSLVSYGVDGFAYATETTVAMWLGCGDEGRARASAGAALLWGVSTGVLFAVVYVAGVDPIARIFTTDAHVQRIIREMVWVVAISQPINALAYIFDGILIGATDTRYLMRAMLISSLTFVLVVSAGWVLSGLSLALIWWSAVVFMAMRALTLAVRYRSSSWSQVVVSAKEGV